ncbi:MAG: hypothetical protein QM737_04150 [Ferruginibacter sp.]
MPNSLKKIATLFIFLLLINKTNVNAQVGIGVAPPDPSAMLHVQDTAKGMLIPRMTAAQRAAIPSPAEGLLVYETSDLGKGFWYFTNGQWKSFANSIGKATVVLSDTITNAEAQLKIANEVGTATQEIRIMRCSNLTSVDLSMIKTLIEIYVSDNPVLQTLNFSNLTSVDGGIYINNCPQLHNLVIGALTRVGRTFNGSVGLYINTTDVPIVNLPSLKIVAGGIRIKNDSSLTSISMPQLTNILGTSSEGLDISSNPVLTTCNFQSLQHVNVLRIQTDPLLASFNLSSLAKVDASFYFSGNIITNLSLPALVSTGPVFDITGNALTSIQVPSLVIAPSINFYGPALQGISLPVLDSLGGFSAKGNSITSISAPLARMLGYVFTIDSCASLTSISFPSAIKANDVFISHCPVITSISFPALTTVTGSNGFEVYSNANLTSISLNNLANFVSVDFYMANNKLPSSEVNALLHLFVSHPPLSVNTIFNLKQVPPAPPSGQGIIDKATLAAAPNTVTTD